MQKILENEHTGLLASQIVLKFKIVRLQWLWPFIRNLPEWHYCHVTVTWLKILTSYLHYFTCQNMCKRDVLSGDVLSWGHFVRTKRPHLALPLTIKYFFVLNFWCIFRNGLLTKRPKVRHEIGRRIRKAKNCVSMFTFCHVTVFWPVYTGRNFGRGRPRAG